MPSGSCPRQQMSPTEPSRSMWRAISTSLPIAAALILLPAVAFASPPDPSWIAGIYDGADGDDIVTLVYETAASHPAVLVHFAPLPCLSDMPPESIVRGFPLARLTPGPRAPPSLYSPVSAHVCSSLLNDLPRSGCGSSSHPRVDHRVLSVRGDATSMCLPAATSCPGRHSHSSQHDVSRR